MQGAELHIVIALYRMYDVICLLHVD